MNSRENSVPSSGFKGIIHHWKDDLTASISVAVVALPLGLGIALASGAPPMAGITAAVIGGIVTTLFRGSHVAINGPAAGLITVILAGVMGLADENGSGYPYVLAAIVIAGGLQMILGLFKMGKLGDMFPSSVVYGMLAAIGVIIFAKQFHVALGVDTLTYSGIDALVKIPQSMSKLNPFVTFIAVVSMAILIVWPKITNKFIHTIPAPVWVLVVSIPLVFLFNHLGNSNIEFMGHTMSIGSEYLINIPDRIQDSIIFPDFSKIDEPFFWLTVISITLVASIETLISTKAVDKLDQYKRRTNLNKDLFAVGLSTVISGMIGALPIITVIVRSSVNVQHDAKTKWSNFYHGIILLALVLFFPYLIRVIPQSCLAAILIYTGYKLASPKVFKNTLLKGWEQLAILVITLLSVLIIGLLWGILLGIFVTLIIHLLKSQLSISTFFNHFAKPHIEYTEAEDEVHVEIKGIANFMVILRLMKVLRKVRKKEHTVVDFSKAKLVDSTVLDFIYEYQEKYYSDSGHFEIVGTDIHQTSSNHPNALHVLVKPMQKRLIGRQNELYHFAAESDYTYKPDINWNTNYLKGFKFFEHEIILYNRNLLRGGFFDEYKWEISDVTYTEGVLMATEEYSITVMYIILPFKVNEFVSGRYNRSQLETIKSNYRRRVSEKDPYDLLTEDFMQLLVGNDMYYVEAKNSAILIYRKERLASSKEVVEMYNFGKNLCKVIPVKKEET